MTYVRRLSLIVALCATVAIIAPMSALAAGPVTTPEVIFTEGFDIPSGTYTTTATAGGSWGRWTHLYRTGQASLWCDGADTFAATHAPYWYAEGSMGTATFLLPQAADYYKPMASFYYLYPSRGDDDYLSFAPEWTSNVQESTSWASGLSGVNYPAATWTKLDLDLTVYHTGQTRESLSRRPGKFRLWWKDTLENDPNGTKTHTGQGPSIDDLTISGWRFGPVRSLTATTTSVSATLAWSRPWHSTDGTPTEERDLSFRVYRARKSAPTAWTELTTVLPRVAQTGDSFTFTDSTVADGVGYTYAVQPWAPGSSETTGYGQYVSVDATTKPFPLPTVTISSPASGTVVVGSGSATVTGTAAAFDGATISAVKMQVKREDNQYFNALTGSWVATPYDIAATVNGANWSAAWTPTAADYLAHSYTITSTATDNRGKTASASVKVKADSVPRVAPVTSIASPSANSTVTTTGTFEISGSATVQTGLPLPVVEVSLSHGSLWWDGSAWSPTQTWVPAAVVGTTWTLSGVEPPANEYGTPSYTAWARARDAHDLTGTSAPRTFTVDSVAFIAPTITMAKPENGVDLLGYGPYEFYGTAASTNPALPLTSVNVTIRRDDGRYWDVAISDWTGLAVSNPVQVTGAWTFSWVAPSNEYLTHQYTITASATDAHELTSSTSAVVRVNSRIPNPPDVAVTFPSTSKVVAAPPIAISGTTAGRDGAVVQQVFVHIGRSTAATGAPASWWDGSNWVGSESQATFLAASGYTPGDPTWTYSWSAPQEYLAHEYTFRAYAHDDGAPSLVGTSAPVSAQIDSLAQVPPKATVVSPQSATSAAPLNGRQPVAVTGTASSGNLAVALSSVKATITAARSPMVLQYWNGSSWQSSPTSVTVAGLSTWSTQFTPLRGDDHRYAYTITSTATDARGAKGNSSSVVVYADNVYPKITSARSLGRYCVMLQFNEPVFSVSPGKVSLRALSTPYFSVAGMRLGRGEWTGTGTAVRFVTSRQEQPGGNVSVTTLYKIQDFAGNQAP